MTGQQILEDIATGPKVRTTLADGTTVERRDAGLAPAVGMVDEAVLVEWTADATPLTREKRLEIARRLRSSLMRQETGGSPSLATTAALIDMLEA